MSKGTCRLVVILSIAAVSALGLAGVGAGTAVAAPGTWRYRINAYRASYGVAPLREDLQASQVAQRWTQQMALTGRLAHNPYYKVQVTTPWYRIGENIGAGGSEATLFAAMVASPGHSANMRRPEFNRVGIGQVVHNGRLWTTHIFLATRY